MLALLFSWLFHLTPTRWSPVFSFSEMQLHISPSLRHITVLPAKGFREFFKVKIGSRRLSYRMVFYSLLFLTFLLRFVFVLTAVDAIDGQSRCSSIGTSAHLHSVLHQCRYGLFITDWTVNWSKCRLSGEKVRTENSGRKIRTKCNFLSYNILNE